MDRKRMKAAAGFTLIELLVVVAILVILIAILVPALFRVRQTARRSATQSQMSGIQMAIDSYYQSFRAYPGPIPTRDYGNGTTVFSESQALVVSLSRAFTYGGGGAVAAGPAITSTAVSPATLGTAIPNTGGAGNLIISADPNVPPRDYSENSGAGYRTYNSYYNAKPEQLMTTACGLNPANDAPVLCDSAYGGDALPIFYYRMDTKYDTSVGNQTVLVKYNSAGGNGGIASYYIGSNDYLATQMNTGGNSISKAAGATKFTMAGTYTVPNPPNGAYPAPGSTCLDDLVSTSTVVGAATVYSPHGGYVLISAGTDRIFGRNPSNPTGAPDDIVIAGAGQ